jgi:hypothetical protein
VDGKFKKENDREVDVEWFSRRGIVRRYQDIEPFLRQDDWLTDEQAARELKVSNTVVKRLIREHVLPATQILDCAPWDRIAV